MTSRQFIWLADCNEDGNNGTRPPPSSPLHPQVPAERRGSGGSWKHLSPFPKLPKVEPVRGRGGWQLGREGGPGTWWGPRWVVGGPRMDAGWGVGPRRHAWCRLTRILQCLDVLRSGRLLRHHLHESGPGILVQLEHWGERQGGAAGPPRHPVGAPAHSSLPCSTCRWLMASRVESALRDPSASDGTAVCTQAPGQPTGTGTQPSRGNGRSRAWRHNHDRRSGRGNRGLTSRPVWCHFPADRERGAGVHREDSVGTHAPRAAGSPDCRGLGAEKRTLGDPMSVPIDTSDQYNSGSTTSSYSVFLLMALWPTWHFWLPNSWRVTATVFTH